MITKVFNNVYSVKLLDMTFYRSPDGNDRLTDRSGHKLCHKRWPVNKCFDLARLV